MHYNFLLICVVICMLVCGCTDNKTNLVNKTPLVTQPTPLPVLHVKYFTTTNCPLCAETDILLENLSVKYPGRLVIVRYDLSFNQSNRDTYMKYSSDLKTKVVPFIVINEKNRFINYSQIVKNLEPSITGTNNL